MGLIEELKVARTIVILCSIEYIDSDGSTLAKK